MNRNFFTTIRAGAADPRRPLLSTRDGRTYSYADAFDAAGRFAAFFAELGMSKGDRLVAQVDKSPEALFLYLACLRAGVVFVPLNTGYTLGEVEYFLTDAQPSLVVCRPEFGRRHHRTRNAAWYQCRRDTGRRPGRVAHRAIGCGTDPVRRCVDRRRGPGRAPLHVGNDGAIQRCDAHA